MRSSFIETLTELAAGDESIEVLTGDLGFGIWDDFASRYPDRFTNAGIAEQNMVSMAAGMALMGKKVFVYSIGNFPTLRCLEQIRNDCAGHGADVKIVSAGTGLSYGPLGISHHATEDLSALRAIPDLRIYCPSDRVETAGAVREMAALRGACYLRLGRDGNPLHREPVEPPIPCCLRVRGEGNSADVVFLVCGDVVTEAVEARSLLAQEGIAAWVCTVPRLKPLASDAILRFSGKTGLLVTVEEHSIIGGLGSAAAEVMAEHPCGLRLLRIGLRDIFPEAVGSRDYLRGEYGLTADRIAGEVKRALDKRACQDGRP